MHNGSELWNKRMALELETRTLSSGRIVETYRDLPESLYAAAARNAAAAPEKLAVSDDLGRSFSYRALLHAADQAAYVLKRRFGVKTGSHVALMIHASTEFAILFLALVKLGAVAVMLPTKYRRPEIRALAERADLDFVICDTDYEDYFAAERERGLPVITYHAQKETFGLAAFLREDCPDEPPQSGEEDVSVMMFTSGTTSQSKGVLLTNLALMHAAATYQKLFSITAEDSTVLPVPIYMITGLSALFGTLLFAGGSVHFQKLFCAREVLRCIEEKQVTFLHAAPTVYALLLAEKACFPKLESLRCAACGGGWSSRQLEQAMHEWLPDCDFRTVYGMTETASPATVLPEDAAKSPHAQSNGSPIPGLRMIIAGPRGEELGCGQTGEILMKGTNLLSGYYRLETPLYRDGWLHTGDLGYMTEDGYCYVVDRVKDMINRGGEKIVSSDVEKALLDVEGVEEATVVGIPHAIYGEAPAALVKCAPSALWNEEGLRAALKSRIAGYKIPVRIRFTEEIPLTPNGKYNKKAIRDLFRQQSGTARQQ